MAYNVLVALVMRSGLAPGLQSQPTHWPRVDSHFWTQSNARIQSKAVAGSASVQDWGFPREEHEAAEPKYKEQLNAASSL